MDIVNEKDEVIWQATREEIYARKQIHRIVHVMIRNEKGDFLLQTRSANTRYLPLHLCTSAGGHVDAWESYHFAASRELEEEAGIRGDLRKLGYYLYQADDGLDKFTTTFETIVDEGFVANPEEVDSLDFFSFDEVNQIIEKDEKVHPELKDVWLRFYSKQ